MHRDDRPPDPGESLSTDATDTPEEMAAAVAAMEDELRKRLDVTDPMHPDNPDWSGSPRTMLWWQAASWIVGREEER